MTSRYLTSLRSYGADMAINRITIEKDGLEVFLDYYKSKHGGHGYADFVRMYKDIAEHGATKARIAREFHLKSHNTVTAWIERYKAEQQ